MDNFNRFWVLWVRGPRHIRLVLYPRYDTIRHLFTAIRFQPGGSGPYTCT